MSLRKHAVWVRWLAGFSLSFCSVLALAALPQEAAAGEATSSGSAPEAGADGPGDAKPAPWADMSTEDKVDALGEATLEMDESSGAVSGAKVSSLLTDTDTLWTCLAAFLVFFMQAGFAMVECGFTRAKNACNILMKNLMDFSIGSLSFWLVGFGLMFGVTFCGLFGTSNFFYDAGDDNFNWAFLLFQTVFCATAATIVSGAMAERTKFPSYLIYTVGITVIVYPIFGSWAWGSLAAGDGWLENVGSIVGLPQLGGEDVGFLDFAGSTVVHSIGGWCALAGAIVLGPRIGKYSGKKTTPIPQTILAKTLNRSLRPKWNRR